MGNVVVGLDGSETSREAFAEAIKQAEWRQGEVVAVHVVHFPVVNAYTMGYLDTDALRTAAADWLRDELDVLRERYDGSFPVPVTGRACVGHYGSELIAVAGGGDAEAADLLVVGSRGLGGFRGLLLGSVSTYVIHHAPCQVLIVPPADADHAEAAAADQEELLAAG